LLSTRLKFTRKRTRHFKKILGIKYGDGNFKAQLFPEDQIVVLKVSDQSIGRHCGFEVQLFPENQIALSRPVNP